jgi:hypothetical protein
MTLCIAAACDYVQGRTAKIVLCSDMQKEVDGIGGAETENKVNFVRQGWPTLIAGTIHKANSLVNEYALYFHEHFSEVTEFNLEHHLRQPLHVQKKKLADEYLRQTYTFDTEYLYGRGASALPESLFTKISDEVTKIRIGASLIIAGFIDETYFQDATIEARPFLGVVSDSGDGMDPDYVQVERDFASIGSGNFAATTSLYRREQNSSDSLCRTIYNVYEANRLSENVPGVGKGLIDISILHQDGHMEGVSEAGYEHLQKLYADYGPRPIKDEKMFELESEFTEPY